MLSNVEYETDKEVFGTNHTEKTMNHSNILHMSWFQSLLML